jgi:hypothetical protein
MLVVGELDEYQMPAPGLYCADNVHHPVIGWIGNRIRPAPGIGRVLCVRQGGA